MNSRHETYPGFANGMPAFIQPRIFRDISSIGDEANFHDNPEIQLCQDGGGYLLIEGIKYPFVKGDIAYIPPNAVHYTGTSDSIEYACLILDTDFCESSGFNTKELFFNTVIKSEVLKDIISSILDAEKHNDYCRTARLRALTLEMLIELYSSQRVGENSFLPNAFSNSKFDAVKQAIIYIRRHYSEKLTLEKVSEQVFMNKYSFCRRFSALTGTTFTKYVNRYRCKAALEMISSGMTVSEAAYACGFSNLSFFTKTFKEITGNDPSYYKSDKNR